MKQFTQEELDEFETKNTFNFARIAELEKALKVCDRWLHDPDAEPDDGNKVIAVIPNALKG